MCQLRDHTNTPNLVEILLLCNSSLGVKQSPINSSTVHLATHFCFGYDIQDGNYHWIWYSITAGNLYVDILFVFVVLNTVGNLYEDILFVFVVLNTVGNLNEDLLLVFIIFI